MQGRTKPDCSRLFIRIVKTHPEARLRFGVGSCVLFLITYGSCEVVSQEPVFGLSSHTAGSALAAGVSRSTDLDVIVAASM